jgi:hypothetical protein
MNTGNHTSSSSLVTRHSETLYTLQWRLNHNAHDLKQHVLPPIVSSLANKTQKSVTHRSRHSRQLGVGIICWCNLDDVRPDKLQSIEASDYGPQLARRPAAGLWRASRGRERRIQRVDYVANISRLPICGVKGGGGYCRWKGKPARCRRAGGSFG